MINRFAKSRQICYTILFSKDKVKILLPVVLQSTVVKIIEIGATANTSFIPCLNRYMHTLLKFEMVFQNLLWKWGLMGTQAVIVEIVKIVAKRGMHSRSSYSFWLGISAIPISR